MLWVECYLVRFLNEAYASNCDKKYVRLYNIIYTIFIRNIIAKCKNYVTLYKIIYTIRGDEK